MTAAKVRRAEARQDDEGGSLRVSFDNGESVALRAFSDTLGNIYARISFVRAGQTREEEIVTTLGDGIHRYVTRGIRAQI